MRPAARTKPRRRPKALTRGELKIASLSKRLQAIAELVPPVNCLADIGTDHALLPVYLVEKGTVSRVVAVEKESGPALRARHTVAAHGLEQQIEVRVGDGLSPLLPGEAQVIVIAGLGGEKIAAILARGKEVARTANRLVLQPMSQAAKLRRWLVANGWRIEKECLVEEKKRLYQVIVALPGEGQKLSWIEEELGPVFVHSGNPLLGKLINALISRYQRELAGLAKSSSKEATARQGELRKRLAALEALRQGEDISRLA